MNKVGRVKSPVRTLLTVGSMGTLTDGQLLERFSTGHGEGAELAFAALVERHGPMVLRVCRSVLAEPHDAEDAFQATFLVLVKKARGLWVDDSLGPWLHQVAFRTASSALKDALRRRRHERRAAELADSTFEGDEGARDEMENLLHAEINRLPERYRVPIVLCDLESQSYEHAARHLGWPIGTVKSRLARGRDRLRDRLRRRGLVPGIEPIAVALRPAGLDAAVPPALVQSTTIAAVRFGAAQAVASAQAAALAQGVLYAMSVVKWVKVASVLLVAGMTVSGVGLMSRMAASGVEPGPQESVRAKPGSNVPLAQVSRGKFKLGVSGPGTIETVRRSTLLCRVQGGTTILSLLDEGTKVKKGDLVGELDTAMLRDQLTNQKINTQGEELSYENKKLARESAEIARREYQAETYPLEQAALQGEIRLAESAIQKANAQRVRTRHLQERIQQASRKDAAAESSALISELNLANQLDAVEQTVMREQLTLDQARGKLKVLENYTKPRTIQDLNSQVADREAAELASKRRFQRSLARERDLERQIESCKLFAPGDGAVVYANDPSRAGGPPQIREGATVRERQILVWIDDVEGPMQVNAKMPESMVDREKIGQKALIKVDAFPDVAFSGEVLDISPLPDPSRISNQNEKVYTTHIKIAEGSPKLRPGMSAQVEILLSERDDAITVQAGAVIRLDGKDRVAVKKADGGFDWREVTVGEANDAVFEIKEGIQPGEEVAADPMELLSKEERGGATYALSSYIRKIMEERPRVKAARKYTSSPFMQKFRNISPEDRAKLKTAGQQEREAILKKAGFTDAEVKEMEERAKQFRRPGGAE
jgi:RNA polymerase sigma factor (sigma-70 family)